MFNFTLIGLHLKTLFVTNDKNYKIEYLKNIDKYENKCLIVKYNKKFFGITYWVKLRDKDGITLRFTNIENAMHYITYEI